jgi:hypothetical protein
MRRSIVLTAAAAAIASALTLAALAAQQEMLPRPGPGSGKMTVDVLSMPPVQAVQSGEWRVTLLNPPQLQPAALDFVRVGSRYEITWATGEHESVTVTAVGGHGWIRTDRRDRAVWVNTAAMRSIEAQPQP